MVREGSFSPGVLLRGGGEVGESHNQAGRARLLIVLVLSLLPSKVAGGLRESHVPTLQAMVPTCCGGREILPPSQTEGPLPSWPHGIVGWTKAAQ